MNFKDLLLRAKDGDQQAKEEIFLMYRPLLFKESCVNGIFDEDLFQELSATLIHCMVYRPAVPPYNPDPPASRDTAGAGT